MIYQKTTKRLAPRSFLLSLSLAMLVGGCESEGPGDVGLSNGDGNGNNNGEMDSGSEDSGSEDSGDNGGDDAGDSGGDAEVDDASVERTCTLEPGEVDIMIDDHATSAETGARPWDAIMVNDTVHVLFQVKTCTESPTNFSGLQYLSLKSTGEIAAPTNFVNMETGTCAVTRAPALVDPGNGEIVAYYNTQTVDYKSELHRRLVSGSDAERLTTDDVIDTEELTMSIPFGGTELIGYVNAKPDKLQQVGKGQLVTRRPGLDENVIVAEDEGSHFADLGIIGFNSGASGGALAWLTDVATDPEKPAITLQKLTASGTATGDRIELSNVPGSASNVSMATISGSDLYYGAVVYGESPDQQRTEIRFRTLNKTGDLVGPVRKITSGNRDAQGASLAEFAGGYVIAYRLNTGESPAIRLSFVDPSGQMAAGSERTFVGADNAGPETKVFVASDGRIIVVFSNQKKDGQQLRVVRGICDP